MDKQELNKIIRLQKYFKASLVLLEVQSILFKADPILAASLSAL
jgi:hypothetical protein